MLLLLLTGILLAATLLAATLLAALVLILCHAFSSVGASLRQPGNLAEVPAQHPLLNLLRAAKDV
jgi:hypothetical protein